MEKKNPKMVPSTSLLMGNLVDGIVDNELDLNDPIVKYLVKNEGWNDKGENSDSEVSNSEDSDIEVLIEEHILLEKLKQVRGKEQSDKDISQNDSDFELNDDGEPDKQKQRRTTKSSSDMTVLVLMKAKIEEAMQINLKMREELLAMEKKLVQIYREACDKKQERLKEDKLAVVRSKSQPLLPLDRFIYSFRSPYFKSDGSVAPLNFDFEKIADTNITLMADDVDWSENNIASLCLAIRKYLIQEQSALQRDVIRNSGNKSVNLCDLFHLKGAPLGELLANRDDDSLDWRFITSLVSRPVTEKECRQIWAVHIKPSLREWTHQEHTAMVKFGKENNLQNWDKVAKALNTNRSGFACFSQHQSNYILEWNDGKWTKEDELYLNHVFENCKIGNSISWDKVSYFMDTKYIDQIYSKWHSFHAPHLTRGPFSEREDKILLGMVHKFGTDLKSVAAVLKNRSLAQLQARYRDHLLTQLRLRIGEWTVDEDERLLELVKEHGERRWAVIAQHFRTRSRIQIRHRYRLLKQKLVNNPDLNLNLISRPRRPTSKKRVYRNKKFCKVISAKGKSLSLMINETHNKQKRPRKIIDRQLTHYFQVKFLKDKIKEAEFLNRFEQRANARNTCKTTLTDDVTNEHSSLEVTDKSLLSFLLRSSITLNNFYETQHADEWSQKDRTAFSSIILKFCASKNKKLLEELMKWHNVVCSLFATPALFANMKLGGWKEVLDTSNHPLEK